MTFDVKCVVAVSGCAYGVGATIKEAEHNLKREDPKGKLRALRLYSCDRAALRFECGVDLTIHSPTDAQCARVQVAV